MNQIQLPKITDFRISKSWRIFLYGGSILFLWAAIWCFFWAFLWSKKNDYIIFGVLGILFLFFWILCFLSAKRSRINIRDLSIIEQGIFWSKELFYSDIIWFSLANTAYTLDVHLKTKSDKIHIYSMFDHADILFSWMQENFKNLDAEEDKKMESLILDASSDKATNIRNIANKEKIVKIIWTHIPYALLLFFFFGRQYIYEYEKYFIFFISCYPLFTLFVAKYYLGNKTGYFTENIWRSQHSRKGTHPLLAGVFILPFIFGLMLLYQNYTAVVSFKYYEFRTLFVVFILYASVLYKFFPELLGKEKTWSKLWEKILWVIFLFFMIWGFLLYFNINSDTNWPLENRTSTVLNKNTYTSDKWSVTYNILIQDWINADTNREIHVDQNLYEQTNIGDNVEVQIYSWKFGIRWFKTIIYIKE